MRWRNQQASWQVDESYLIQPLILLVWSSMPDVE